MVLSLVVATAPPCIPRALVRSEGRARGTAGARRSGPGPARVAGEGVGTSWRCPGIDLGEMKNFDFEKFSDRIFGISRWEAGQDWSASGRLRSPLLGSGEALACLRPGNDGKIIPGPLY